MRNDLKSIFNVVTIFLLMGFVLKLDLQANQEIPSAEKGILDISQYTITDLTKVPLLGEWEMYYGEILYPVDFINPNKKQPLFIHVPELWNDRGLPHFGYATYRLKIIFPQKTTMISFKIEEMFTSYRLYVNGNEVASVGIVNDSRETVIPGYKPKAVQIAIYSQECEVILQIANFHHKKGGFWRTIYCGTGDSLIASHTFSIAYDMLIFGAILMIALYHFVLYSMRRKDNSSLYFAFFSFFIALKLSVSNERILVQVWTSIPWEILVKIVYLSFYLAMPFLVHFFRSLFPELVSFKVVKFYWGIVSLFCLFVCVTPSWIYSYSMLPFEMLTLCCIVYILAILFRASNKNYEARIILIGFLFLAIAGVNDILYDNHIIATFEMVHYGLVAFIFFQSMLLSRRFTATFNKNEHLSIVLEQKAQELEKRNNELVKEISHREIIEKQLVQAQKMEAIGLLAGGVAHDFNNVLGGIMGITSVLRYSISQHITISEDMLYDKLSLIENATNKAAHLVKQLMVVARKHEFSLSPVDLNTIVKNIIKICESTFDKSIRIEVLTIKKPAIVLGDITFLEQVLLNLCINAAHAMTIMRSSSEQQGGILSVSIENFIADDVFLQNNIEASSEAYWLLSIEDSGVGIPEAIRDRLFDPFFTTKSESKGTGLGLAMVDTIVKQHNGFLKVYSQVGVGTTFQIYLPHASTESPLSNEEPAHDQVIKGRGTILVVDDDVFVLKSTSLMLTACGYAVISAENGEKALAIYEKEMSTIDGVVMDMAMPKMSGKDVFLRLKKINKTVKVLLTSGLRHDPQVKYLLKKGVVGFLHKPFSLTTLSIAVYDSLIQIKKN